MTDFIRPRIALIPFLTIWSVYFCFLAVSGYSSVYPNFGQAIILQASFVFLVCAPVLLLPAARAANPAAPSRYDAVVMWGGLAIGIVALISLLIDRVFVQGIDYMLGICTARNQMTSLGEVREGVSSPFSVLGQLLGYVYFVPATVVIVRAVDRRVFWTVTSLAFAILLLQSFVTSSRSTFVVFGAFVLAAVAIRAASRRAVPKIKIADVVMTVALAAVALVYVVAVFQCRASNADQTPAEYAAEAAQLMGAVEAAPIIIQMPAPSSVEDVSPVAGQQADTPAPTAEKSSIRALLELTMLYATHSAFTFAGIITDPGEGSMLLSNAIFLLDRIGVNIDSPTVTLEGKFPSLPGALYYDLGILGVLAGGLLLGCAMWAAMAYIGRGGTGIIGLGASLAVISNVYASPMLLAVNFTIFPFVCFGYVVLAGLATLVARQKATDYAATAERRS